MHRVQRRDQGVYKERVIEKTLQQNLSGVIDRQSGEGLDGAAGFLICVGDLRFGGRGVVPESTYCLGGLLALLGWEHSF